MRHKEVMCTYEISGRLSFVEDTVHTIAILHTKPVYPQDTQLSS